MRSILPLFAIVCAFGLASCSDPSDPGPVPALLEIVDGNNQEGWLAGMRDPLSVRVADRDGTPLEGVSVRWDATVGTVGDGISTGPRIETMTDTAGIATVRWLINGPPVATYELIATVADLTPVRFIGHIRQGIKLTSVELSPNDVDVSTGSAVIRLALTATDDFSLGITAARVDFSSASGDEWIGDQVLELTSGSGHDGRWEADIEFPAHAEPGVWRLRQVWMYRGCHLGGNWDWLTLSNRDFPFEVTVTNSTYSGGNLAAAIVPAPPLRYHPGCRYTDRG